MQELSRCGNWRPPDRRRGFCESQRRQLRALSPLCLEERAAVESGVGDRGDFDDRLSAATQHVAAMDARQCHAFCEAQNPRHRRAPLSYALNGRAFPPLVRKRGRTVESSIFAVHLRRMCSLCASARLIDRPAVTEHNTARLSHVLNHVSPCLECDEMSSQYTVELVDPAVVRLHAICQADTIPPIVRRPRADR
jgi:hypothetical protein